MIMTKFSGPVGVAPGTTTVQLDGAPILEREQWYPIDPLSKWQGRLPLGQAEATQPTAVTFARSRIRWDIIALIGGGSLVIALAIGLVASALSPR